MGTILIVGIMGTRQLASQEFKGRIADAAELRFSV
jgi:hypothetical protein